MLRLALPLAWILGILLSGYLNTNILVFILAGFSLLLILFVLQWFLTRNKPFSSVCFRFIRKAVLILLVTAMGMQTYSHYEAYHTKKAIHFCNQQPDCLSGVIVSDVSRYNDTCYFDFRLDNRLKLSVRIRCSLPLAPGQRLLLWEPELLPVNPNNEQISQTQKLLGNGVFLSASFPYEAKAEIAGVENPVLFYASKLRMVTADRLEALFPKKISGLLMSLISSDKSSLPEELYEDFITTGTVHIIVVSGMHFHYLATAVLLLFGIVCHSHRKKLCLTLPLFVLFCWYTGGTIPVLRSFLMISITFLCDIFYFRKLSSQLLILILASGFLAVTPTLIYNPSFLLSFGAALGLAMFQKQFSYHFRRIPVSWIRDYLAMHTAVQIFTLPVIAFFFQRVSKVAILSNFLVAPLVAPILILGIAVLFLAKIPLVSTAIVWILKTLSTLFLWLISTTARLETPTRVPIRKTTLILLLSTGVIFFFLLQIKQRKQKTIALILWLMLSGGSLISMLLPCPNEAMLVTFLGAKNTNSAVITTAENRHILFGDLNDIFRGKSGAAFRNDAEIPLLILPEISNPEYLAEFLKEYRVNQLVTLKKYQSKLILKQAVFLDSTVTATVDGIEIRIVADQKACYEVSFTYAGQTLTFSSNADYIYENLLQEPDKTLILNLRRNGKTADNIYKAEAIPDIFSKKELHPDRIPYNNFSILQVDQSGIRALEPTE